MDWKIEDKIAEAFSWIFVMWGALNLWAITLEDNAVWVANALCLLWMVWLGCSAHRVARGVE